MGYAARNKRRKMATELKLPEKTHRALASLYQAQQQAVQNFQGPLLIALDFLGLDPMLNHQINFETGIITPAEPLPKPELLKEEEAS